MFDRQSSVNAPPERPFPRRNLLAFHERDGMAGPIRQRCQRDGFQAALRRVCIMPGSEPCRTFATPDGENHEAAAYRPCRMRCELPEAVPGTAGFRS